MRCFCVVQKQKGVADAVIEAEVAPKTDRGKADCRRCRDRYWGCQGVLCRGRDAPYRESCRSYTGCFRGRERSMVAHMCRLCRSILRPALALLPPAQAGDLPPARRQGPWSPVVSVSRPFSFTIAYSYDPEDVGNRSPRATQSRAMRSRCIENSSVTHVDFGGKIRQSGISDAMTYSPPNSRKSPCAPEPSRLSPRSDEA